jgi:predicted small lipoprotein YifL
MRNVHSSLKVLTALAVMAAFTACGGAGETAENPDSAAAAAAAAAAPPPAESFTLMAEDGSWSGDITPAGIVFRHKRNDSLMFEFKPPMTNGAISDYDILMTAKDTVRLTISMAMTACTDKQGNSYTHMAQVWLSGDVKLESKGCAIRK